MSSTAAATSLADPTSILNFWFDNDVTRMRGKWFMKDTSFDEQIRRKFLPTIEAAARGDLKSWEEERMSALALVILLDQFPRNVYRNTAKSFATDAEALRVTEAVHEKGWYQKFTLYEKLFVVLPFGHSEDLEKQKTAVALIKAMGAEGRQFIGPAQLHMDVIQQWGRFPHRNEMLGRESTATEEKFLAEGGTRF